jgi:hypothetical protein
VRRHRNRRGNRRGYRADEDVAVPDVRQFVGDDPFQLVLAEHLEDALGRRDGGM